MIVNLFRHTQATSILSVLGLCIFLWMGISFQETNLNSDCTSPLFNFLISPIIKFELLERLLLSGLVFWQCIYINKIMVGHKILSANSFFPALFFCLIISFWPQALHLSSELLGISFILIALNKTLETYLSENYYSNVFELSFSFSLATLLHPPFFVFIPLIWIGMSIFSQLEWRNWVLSILALLTPWVVLLSYTNYFKVDDLQLINFFNFIYIEDPEININKTELIGLVILVIVFIIAINELLKSLSKKNIKARKSYIYLMWILPLFIFYFLLSPTIIWHKLLILTIPFTVIISNYFYYNKKSNWLNFIGILMLTYLLITHFLAIN
tara:strand:+ start:770 stop:1750 length:981 start_codon:yes stop_codon:yes gene_type:complete